MTDDFDWIQDYEKINEKMKTCQEKELPDYITIYFYYISHDNNIESIRKKKYYPQHDRTSILIEELIELNAKYKGTQYRLDEILLFEVEEGAAIENPSASMIKSIPLVLENIEIKPSLFIYHDIQSIYFMYKKKQKRLNNTVKRVSTESISFYKNRHTKRNMAEL